MKKVARSTNILNAIYTVFVVLYLYCLPSELRPKQRRKHSQLVDVDSQKKLVITNLLYSFISNNNQSTFDYNLPRTMYDSFGYDESVVAAWIPEFH
jgi:hypothetical protein